MKFSNVEVVAHIIYGGKSIVDVLEICVEYMKIRSVKYESKIAVTDVINRFK
jgi:hypothetical protein